MKRLFFCLLVFLLAAGGITWWIQPSHLSDVPTLFWVTTNSPIRNRQVASFENWLVEKGYPPVHLRIDAANNDPSKKLIQGISGVGGDLFDNYADQTYLMQSTGILADLTGPARQYGFGPESTFESIRSNFMIDGRQWGYPASTSIALLLVNVEAFRDAGLGIPPRAWDIETFEEWGRRYVAANRLPGERQRRFFANSVERYELMRSLGLSIYNETLTACCLDDPRYIRVLEKVHQWIFRDHLLPGPEEESTFAVEGSGLGVSMALFARGNYAMLNLGRFALVRLRNYGRQDYSASFMPHFEYINCRVAGGTVGLYTKSEKKEHAYRFFEYLASDTHNRMIVETGDALPVNPDFLDSEEFLRPPEFPNEWRVHEAYAEAMKKHSISRSSSPFILPEIGRRVEVDTYRSFIADQISAAQAASLVQERINDEITRSLKERPSLMPEYERRVRIQERIEDLKRDGLPIPEAWLFNPFHRRYYQDMGSVREGDVVQ